MTTRHAIAFLAFVTAALRAATYQVGPTRTCHTFNALFGAIDLGSAPCA